MRRRLIAENAADAREGYGILRSACSDDTLEGLIDALERSHLATLRCLRVTDEKLTTIELTLAAACERAGL